MTVLLNVELLEQFARRLRAQGVPAIDAARPGRSDPEMQALVSQLGLTLPYEARVWWGWRDGVPQAAGSAASGIGLFRWLPLEEAVEECVTTRSLIRSSAEDDPRDAEDLWSSSWLPLVSGGGSVVIDTDVAEGAPCPVRVYWFDEPEAPPDLCSVGELLKRAWMLGSVPSPSRTNSRRGLLIEKHRGGETGRCTLHAAKPFEVWEESLVTKAEERAPAFQHTVLHRRRNRDGEDSRGGP